MLFPFLFLCLAIAILFHLHLISHIISNTFYIHILPLSLFRDPLLVAMHSVPYAVPFAWGVLRVFSLDSPCKNLSVVLDRKVALKVENSPPYWTEGCACNHHRLIQCVTMMMTKIAVTATPFSRT